MLFLGILESSSSGIMEGSSSISDVVTLFVRSVVTGGFVFVAFELPSLAADFPFIAAKADFFNV
ncbi:hypothetical protein PanWU01x14_368990, partial [Parasponia andersonii]